MAIRCMYFRDCYLCCENIAICGTNILNERVWFLDRVILWIAAVGSKQTLDNSVNFVVNSLLNNWNLVNICSVIFVSEVSTILQLLVNRGQDIIYIFSSITIIFSRFQNISICLLVSSYSWLFRICYWKYIMTMPENKTIDLRESSHGFKFL